MLFDLYPFGWLIEQLGDLLSQVAAVLLAATALLRLTRRPSVPHRPRRKIGLWRL